MAVSTEPVPAITFLVGAGNFDSIGQVHPALMDRIYGYGKVVRMNNDMPNTLENRRKNVPAHLPVQPAHPVDCPASSYSQVCHIKRFRRVIRVSASKGH